MHNFEQVRWCQSTGR